MEDERARIGQLQYVGVIDGLFELRRVVVGVGDVQIELSGCVQRWTALDLDHNDHCHVGLLLAIQRQRDDNVDEVVVHRPA